MAPQRSSLLKAVAAAAVIAVAAASLAALMTASYRHAATETPGSSSSTRVSYASLFKEALTKARELGERGYDVILAEYYLLSSKYFWGRGDRAEAVKLLRKAEELLNNSTPLPPVAEPIKGFEIVREVADARRSPTAWDFVPLGKVFVLTREGYLDYPRNDYIQWRLSCFILGAVGRDGSGHLVLYQGRLPLRPEENPFKPKLYIGGRWYVPNLVFAGPLYYKEGPNYVEVYEYDLSGRFVESLKYVPGNRTWVHVIARVGGGPILRIIAEGEGAPMWLGVWGESFTMQGAYPKDRAFDLWAGFWDVGPMNATLYLRGREVRFTGYLIVDRASHRRLPIGGSAPRPAGWAPLAFSCMVVHQDGLTVMVADARIPPPLTPPAAPEHQLRLDIPSLGINAVTENFTLTDDGSLQPKMFKLVARFGNTYLNLTGRAVVYWPPRWPTGVGAWWDANASYSWGRAFIRWSGEVVVGGHVIKVDALGMGEFTRYSPARSPKTSSGGCGCWRGPG